MCTTPLRIVNPRYKALRKRLTNSEWRDFLDSELDSIVDYYVTVPCGKCAECIRDKAASWRWRLIREYECSRSAIFVLLTVDPEHLAEVTSDPTAALRKYFEAIREHTPGRKSISHWFTIEYGDSVKHTGRIHFHGLFFFKTKQSLTYNQLRSFWPYGFSTYSPLRGPSGCTYVSKYITKDFSPTRRNNGKVFCSPGIGNVTFDFVSASLRHIKGLPTTTLNLGGFSYTLPYYYYCKFVPESLRRTLNTVRRICKFADLVDMLDSPSSQDYVHYLDKRRRFEIAVQALPSFLNRFRRFLDVDESFPLKVSFLDCLTHWNALKNFSEHEFNSSGPTRPFCEIKRIFARCLQRYDEFWHPTPHPEPFGFAR